MVTADGTIGTGFIPEGLAVDAERGCSERWKDIGDLPDRFTSEAFTDIGDRPADRERADDGCSVGAVDTDDRPAELDRGCEPVLTDKDGRLVSTLLRASAVSADSVSDLPANA